MAVQLCVKNETRLSDDFLKALLLSKSGYQDSNLGPPAPKAGALAGLRYIPIAQKTTFRQFRGCKVTKKK